MRPQYYSWLFDNKSAWEKSLADPRYSYDLPMDFFMSIYCSERGADPNAPQFSAMPALSAPAIPMVSNSAMAAAILNTPLDASSVIAPGQSKEEKKEEGILSQDDIDALLSGL